MDRGEILKQIWASQDESYELMSEYDSLQHYYSSVVLYQAEAYIINRIGQVPGITTTKLAVSLNKTPSACSQIVKKLVSRGLVIQDRNQENKRLYNLFLTEEGESVYQAHIAFNQNCQQITFEMLKGFSDEELAIYLKVQTCINEAYRGDVQRSRDYV